MRGDCFFEDSVPQAKPVRPRRPPDATHVCRASPRAFFAYLPRAPRDSAPELASGISASWWQCRSCAAGDSVQPFHARANQIACPLAPARFRRIRASRRLSFLFGRQCYCGAGAMIFPLYPPRPRLPSRSLHPSRVHPSIPANAPSDRRTRCRTSGVLRQWRANILHRADSADVRASPLNKARLSCSVRLTRIRNPLSVPCPYLFQQDSACLQFRFRSRKHLGFVRFDGMQVNAAGQRRKEACLCSPPLL